MDWYTVQLADLGLLRPLAAAPLTDLVVALCLRDDAARVLAAEGITTDGRCDGETIRHPAMMAWRGAGDAAHVAKVRGLPAIGF